MFGFVLSPFCRNGGFSHQISPTPIQGQVPGLQTGKVKAVPDGALNVPADLLKRSREFPWREALGNTYGIIGYNNQFENEPGSF